MQKCLVANPDRERGRYFGLKSGLVSRIEQLCNYLIKSDVGCSDLAPYPPLNNVYGQTGDVTELNDDDLCLLPDSHDQSVIDPYESGEMEIVMHASRQSDTDMRAEMTRYYHRDGEEEECSDYVMMRREDLTYTIDLRFPKVGFYKLSVLSGDQLVHQYLINVIEPDTAARPFPKEGRGWRSEYEIRGTQTGNLEADRKYHIQAKVGDEAKNVRGVFDDGQEVKFTKNAKKEWEADVHTDPRGGGQLRILMDHATAGKDVPLLVYNVSRALFTDFCVLRRR